MPQWLDFSPGPVIGVILLTKTHRHASIRITNPDISWEPFHAQIIGAAAGVGVRVAPTAGVLAPRGGAQNVCDPSKPYSDSCDLEICMARDIATADDDDGDDGPAEGGQAVAAESTGAGHLVVCLEQRRWTWQVRVKPAD